jgi:hypothetical protein
MTEAETFTVPGSIAAFIEKHGITGTVTRVDKQPGYRTDRPPFGRVSDERVIETPSKDADGWEHYAWQVNLTRGSQVPIDGLAVPYRTGIGHVERKGVGWLYGTSVPRFVPTPPTIADVLDAVAGDASMWENARDFADFCADLGYDTDSRKAERIYNECGEIAKKLRFFLGRQAYEELLWETERL